MSTVDGSNIGRAFCVYSRLLGTSRHQLRRWPFTPFLAVIGRQAFALIRPTPPRSHSSWHLPTAFAIGIGGGCDTVAASTALRAGAEAERASSMPLGLAIRPGQTVLEESGSDRRRNGVFVMRTARYGVSSSRGKCQWRQ